MLNASLTMAETDAPADMRCATGHRAPENFRREGPDSPSLPMRFFKLSGTANGIYCEACLTVANHLADLKRKEKKNGRS